MQPYFGEKTPKVIAHLQKISEWHRAQKIQLTLKTMAQSVQANFPGKHSGERKVKKNLKDKTENLRHIIFKLARNNKIWFGTEF
jgi:hypothetical protein